VDGTGHETVLYTFTGGADGSQPLGGLVRDAAGNFYGTTSAGDQGHGYGTVFKLDKTVKLTVLHTFHDGADGGWPYGGLVSDGKGSFYGATYYGGKYNAGVVFKITP